MIRERLAGWMQKMKVLRVLEGRDIPDGFSYGRSAQTFKVFWRRDNVLWSLRFSRIRPWIIWEKR